MIRICSVGTHGAYNGTYCPACLRTAHYRLGFASPTDRAEDGLAPVDAPLTPHGAQQLAAAEARSAELEAVVDALTRRNKLLVAALNQRSAELESHVTRLSGRLRSIATICAGQT
jgi:hypothetical protein